MTINVNKSSMQRVYEAGLKHARKTATEYGVVFSKVFPESSAAKRPAKSNLVDAFGFAEVNAYSEAGGKDATTYLMAFEVQAKAIAEKFGLRYAEPGVTLRT